MPMILNYLRDFYFKFPPHSKISFALRYTTLAYRAPEMVDLYTNGGGSIGTPVDIWALGCLIYCLCFFSLPFGSNAIAIQTGKVVFPPASSYSSRLHALIKYLLVVDSSRRPDAFQVSSLAFPLLGRENPVQNVNSSSTPCWHDLILKISEIEAKCCHPPSVSSSESTLPLLQTATSILKSSSSHQPTLAGQRQRTNIIRSSDGTQHLSKLEKPSENANQFDSKIPKILESRHSTKSIPAETSEIVNSEKFYMQNQLNESLFPYTDIQRSLGHRRGASEASTLRLDTAGTLKELDFVRLSLSRPKIHENFSIPSSPLQECSMEKNVGDHFRNIQSKMYLPSKDTALDSVRPIFSSSDLDSDLFGAAFDAIRKQTDSIKHIF